MKAVETLQETGWAGHSSEAVPFSGGVRFFLKKNGGIMRKGLDRVVDALRLAAAGLDQLFERKGIKDLSVNNINR